MKRSFQICCSFSILILFAFYFASCSANDDRFDNGKHEEKTLFVFQVEDIDSTFYYHGLKCEIFAPLEDDSIKFTDSIFDPRYKKYWHRRDTLTIKKYPQGLTLKIISDSLRDTLIITAGNAVYRRERLSFEFSDDVKLISKKFALNTEQLSWEQWKRNFETKETVRITTDDAILNGKGFESDEIFSRYEIKHIITHINLK